MFCARINIKNKSNRVSSDKTQPKKVSFMWHFPPTSHRITPIERITRQPDPVNRRSVAYANQRPPKRRQTTNHHKNKQHSQFRIRMKNLRARERYYTQVVVVE